MGQRGVCGLVAAACVLAAVCGERVPCSPACQGGLINWDGRLGKTACCVPGYKMLVVNGVCLCLSPASAPVSAFVDGDGSVVMVDPYTSQAQYKQDRRRVREDLQQMAAWMGLTMGGMNPELGILHGFPGIGV